MVLMSRDFVDTGAVENEKPQMQWQMVWSLNYVLVKAIVEAMSDNREILRVFHQIISSEFKVIASALFYCIRSSRYFHSS